MQYIHMISAYPASYLAPIEDHHMTISSLSMAGPLSDPADGLSWITLDNGYAEWRDLRVESPENLGLRTVSRMFRSPMATFCSDCERFCRGMPSGGSPSEPAQEPGSSCRTAKDSSRAGPDRGLVICLFRLSAETSNLKFGREVSSFGTERREQLVNAPLLHLDLSLCGSWAGMLLAVDAGDGLGPPRSRSISFASRMLP